MSILKELKQFAKDSSILVVEDDKDLNTELVELLDIFFSKVDFAYDGVEALSLYKNSHYDIVLSDITMPKMNGVKLSQELINLNKSQSIVVLSAHSEITYMIDLIDIGIHQFVAKPFEQQELLYRLLKVCENIVHKKQFQNLKNNSIQISDNNDVLAQKKKITEQISSENTGFFNNEDLSSYIKHTQVDASKFIEDLKIDSLSWISIEPQIEELLEINEEFEELIEKMHLNSVTEELVEKIAHILKKIYGIFLHVDALSNISQVILELSTFLSDLDFEVLSEDRVDKLKILEFIYDDLSRFIQTVFVYQDTLDIHYLEDSLKSSLEQLRMNVLDEEVEEEELEFF